MLVYGSPSESGSTITEFGLNCDAMAQHLEIAGYSNLAKKMRRLPYNPQGHNEEWFSLDAADRSAVAACMGLAGQEVVDEAAASASESDMQLAQEICAKLTAGKPDAACVAHVANANPDVLYNTIMTELDEREKQQFWRKVALGAGWALALMVAYQVVVK